MKPSAIRPILSVFSILAMFTSLESQIPNSGLRIKISDSRCMTFGDAQCPKHDARSTNPEPRKSWIPLFEGESTAGWRSACGSSFPGTGWVIREGALTVLAADKPDGPRGGDIVTLERFSDFDLRFEFRITEGANSGVKYFVQENLPNAQGAAIGLEYQILDDDRNEDAVAGKNGNHSNASLYDLIPARGKQNRPVGEWNSARILVRGGHIEHWLNGSKVVRCERASAEFRRLVSESKYRIYPGFGEWEDGHILLQDHGGEVSFRNMRIRRL